MTESTSLSRPRRRPGARLEHDGGRLFIAREDSEVVLRVNASAAALWQLCDGKTTVEEMVSAICEASSIPPDRALADVERTLSELDRMGVLDYHDEATGEHLSTGGVHRPAAET